MSHRDKVKNRNDLTKDQVLIRQNTHKHTRARKAESEMAEAPSRRCHAPSSSYVPAKDKNRFLNAIAWGNFALAERMLAAPRGRVCHGSQQKHQNIISDEDCDGQAGPTCTFVLAEGSENSTRFEHRVFHEFLTVSLVAEHVRDDPPSPPPDANADADAESDCYCSHACTCTVDVDSDPPLFVTPAILEEARCSRGPLWLAKEVTAALSEDLLEMPDLETLAWVPAVTVAEETSPQQEQQRSTSRFSHSSSAAAMQQRDEGHYLSFLASDNAAITAEVLAARGVSVRRTAAFAQVVAGLRFMQLLVELAAGSGCAACAEGVARWAPPFKTPQQSVAALETSVGIAEDGASPFASSFLAKMYPPTPLLPAENDHHSSDDAVRLEPPFSMLCSPPAILAMLLFDVRLHREYGRSIYSLAIGAYDDNASSVPYDSQPPPFRERFPFSRAGGRSFWYCVGRTPALPRGSDVYFTVAPAKTLRLVRLLATPASPITALRLRPHQCTADEVVAARLSAFRRFVVFGFAEALASRKRIKSTTCKPSLGYGDTEEQQEEEEEEERDEKKAKNQFVSHELEADLTEHVAAIPIINSEAYFPLLLASLETIVLSPSARGSAEAVAIAKAVDTALRFAARRGRTDDVRRLCAIGAAVAEQCASVACFESSFNRGSPPAHCLVATCSGYTDDDDAARVALAAILSDAGA